MAHFTHGWIDTLAGMLDMEEEHCRENLQHYESGPDHDTYAAFLADVLELRKRLLLYDAADGLLPALRAATNELIELYERAYPEDETDNDTTVAIDAGLAAIAKAEGRSE